MMSCRFSSKSCFPDGSLDLPSIVIGALVPAAIMSIGAANLFTRNFWKAYINLGVTALGEARVAKMTSLAVVAGALLFILFLPTHALFGSARARGEHSRSHSRERGAAACRARGSRPCAGRLTVLAGASIPRR